MLVAVSSLGTDLDAWTGVPFGACSQFLVVDSDTMEFVVLSVPPQDQDPTRVSSYALRAIARQGAELVITGPVKDICRQTMQSLGMQVIESASRMSVRDAIVRYAQSESGDTLPYTLPPEKIAVAAHGCTLDSPLASKGEPCTSFMLVDPDSMQFQVVRIQSTASPEEVSLQALRAAVRAGATVVITSNMSALCCAASRALAVSVALANEGLSARQAVELYLSGKLPDAPSA